MGHKENGPFPLSRFPGRLILSFCQDKIFVPLKFPSSRFWLD